MFMFVRESKWSLYMHHHHLNACMLEKGDISETACDTSCDTNGIHLNVSKCYITPLCNEVMLANCLTSILFGH